MLHITILKSDFLTSINIALRAVPQKTRRGSKDSKKAQTGHH